MCQSDFRKFPVAGGVVVPAVLPSLVFLPVPYLYPAGAFPAGLAVSTVHGLHWGC